MRTPSLRGYQAALRTVDRVDGLRTVAAPGSSAQPALAVDVRQALLDAPDAALYYPWLKVCSPTTGRDLALPPSGVVAGVFARVVAARGLHKAPANEVVGIATGLERNLTATQSEQLNPAGVSVLRRFPARGIRVWGARTLSSDPEWKYLNVRRYFAYLEHSTQEGTQWSVFEPNDEPLWALVRIVVSGFLLDEWRAGRLLGHKPDEAYFVRCDRSTMTEADIRARRLAAIVGFAPLKPAEFVIFHTEQRTG